MDFGRISSEVSLKYMKNLTDLFTGLALISIILINFLSCDSNAPSEPADLSPFEIQGSILDTDGNLLTDVDLYLVFNLTESPAGFAKTNSIRDTIVYLNQNFPNPYSDATNISFNIPARAFVKLFLSSFYSTDTLKSILNGNLEKGFYALLFEEKLPNNLYSCRLWVKISADSIFQDEILMLKNNDYADSLIADAMPNYQIFNSTFEINYGLIPFGKTVSVTDSSSIVSAGKVITRELTIVLSKAGYKNLVETHAINSADNTKIIFRMERE